MEPYDYWLHMDEDFMWRWFCSDRNGNLVSLSASSFFHRAEAERSMYRARFAGQALRLVA